VADAVTRVLNGDVQAYETIYRACDRGLRAFVGRRYGHLGDDFVSEVAIRTHGYAFSHLAQYNPKREATFQTWLNLRSLNVAGEVMAERAELHRLGPRGGRRRVALSVPYDEEKHAHKAGSVPGPAEEYEAKMRSRLLWQEYEALAREGRLSVALHDIAGLTLAETARELDMPLIRVRRLLEQNHRGLRRGLRRRGVIAAEPAEPYYGRVRTDTGYDDDWTATSMAYLPDDPDTLVGVAAKSEKEDEHQ